MNLTGVLAPIPTPFDHADRLDRTRLRRALTQWLEHPLSGFVVLGTSGEAALLDDNESGRAIGVARDTIPADRSLIVGTGRESTRSAIRAAKRAAQLGADAVFVRTPSVYKNQMTDEVFVRHYTAVADASPVPVLLYNFPALTGVALHAAAVSQLATHPNIVGLKDSSGDVREISGFATSASDGFSVLSGSASTFYTAVSLGATGGILALACVLPDACVRLFELASAEQHAEAHQLQQRLLPMARLVGSAHGIPGLKAAVQLAGYDVGPPRRPLTPAPEFVVAELRQALAAFEERP